MLNTAGDVDEALRLARYLRKLAFYGICPAGKEANSWYKKMGQRVTELRVRKFLMD